MLKLFRTILIFRQFYDNFDMSKSFRTILIFRQFYDNFNISTFQRVEIISTFRQSGVLTSKCQNNFDNFDVSKFLNFGKQLYTWQIAYSSIYYTNTIYSTIIRLEPIKVQH